MEVNSYYVIKRISVGSCYSIRNASSWYSFYSIQLTVFQIDYFCMVLIGAIYMHTYMYILHTPSQITYKSIYDNIVIKCIDHRCNEKINSGFYSYLSQDIYTELDTC